VTDAEAEHRTSSDELILHLTGRAKSLNPERNIDQISITGDRGIIEGLASFVHRDTRLARSKVPPQDDPWAGFLKHPKGDPPYRVFALFDDGESVCNSTSSFQFSLPDEDDRDHGNAADIAAAQGR
jgi:hypothetical protein